MNPISISRRLITQLQVLKAFPFEGASWWIWSFANELFYILFNIESENIVHRVECKAMQKRRSLILGVIHKICLHLRGARGSLSQCVIFLDLYSDVLKYFLRKSPDFWMLPKTYSHKKCLLFKSPKRDTKAARLLGHKIDIHSTFIKYLKPSKL